MKFLFAGLGNIGPDYVATRHNIGFMVMDYLAEKADVDFEIGRHAFYTEFKHKGRQIILIKPTTYMNLSGKAVGHWLSAGKIPLENLMVVMDDIALPFGTLRMRAKGSHAGHNGLKDIERILGSNAYPRLRFGVGDDFPRGRQADYVLSPFNPDEEAELDSLIARAGEMLLSFAAVGVGHTMNQFNK